MAEIYPEVQIELLNEQITQLKAELDESHGIMEHMSETTVLAWETRGRQLNADLAKSEKAYHGIGELNAKLRIHLTKFAGHTAACALKRSLYRTGVGGTNVMPKCDCGFLKAKKEWE